MRFFVCWNDACYKIKISENLPTAMKELKLLKNCITIGSIKKDGCIKRDYEMLEET